MKASYTSLNNYLRCGYAWYQLRVKKRYISTNKYASAGINLHKKIAENAKSGDMPIETIKSMYIEDNICINRYTLMPCSCNDPFSFTGTIDGWECDGKYINIYDWKTGKPLSLSSNHVLLQFNIYAVLLYHKNTKLLPYKYILYNYNLNIEERISLIDDALLVWNTFVLPKIKEMEYIKYAHMYKNVELPTPRICTEKYCPYTECLKNRKEV